MVLTQQELADIEVHQNIIDELIAEGDYLAAQAINRGMRAITHVAMDRVQPLPCHLREQAIEGSL